MTRNTKPNELPMSIDDLLSNPAAILVVDNYLDRAELVRRIADQAGIDATIGDKETLYVDDMVRLVRHVATTHDVAVPGTIWDTPPENTSMRREGLVAILGDIFGFDPDPGQDVLNKPDQIRVYLALASGDPTDFSLPGEDPDREFGSAVQKLEG